MSRVLMISADGHVGPPVETYREYMEKKFHRAFDDYLSYRSPTLLSAIDTKESIESYEERWHANGKYVSMYDSDLRIKVIEEEGAVAEVLFPDRTRNNEIPFSENPSPDRSSIEEQMAGERAYNRWLAEFCAPHPGRFAGLVSLRSFLDPDAAVTEIEWAAEQPGIRGVMLPGVAPDRGDWLDDDKEKVWAACASANLVVSFHVGAGAPPRGSDQYPRTAAGGMIATFESWFWAQRALWWLIYGGVFERYPTLRAAFTETGSAWAGERVATMDWFTDLPYKLKEVNTVVPAKPSEYFRKNCAIGASILSKGDIAQRHRVGVENMMFGLDIPHFEGTLNMTRDYLQGTFGAGDVSEPEARAMLGENALRFYGFDRSELTPIAERVGLGIDEVLAKPRASIDSDPDFYWMSRPA